MDHFILKCSCGRVIAQCRCPSLEKRAEVRAHGCAVCQAAQLLVAETGLPVGLGLPVPILYY